LSKGIPTSIALPWHIQCYVPMKHLKVFCLARSRKVMFHRSNQNCPGFHNQCILAARCYARRFLCTRVSIARILAFHTAISNSFWSRYNDLERTCSFLQVTRASPRSFTDVFVVPGAQVGYCSGNSKEKVVPWPSPVWGSRRSLPP